MPDYRRLIESLVADPPPFTPTRESATAVQVERGTVLAERLAGRTVSPMPPVRAEVGDAAGHRRPVYRPLLVYAHQLAGVGVEPWLATLAVDAAVAFTAANGSAASAAVWSALALHVGGRPGAASALFRRLIDGQQPNGALLRTTVADNPETHWFHELVILHAAADFAVLTGDAAVWNGVRRAAQFHLNETEPDHATGDPWGLPAFVRLADASPMADSLLHAVSAHRPGGAAGIGLLLLADTLYGLRHAAGDVGRSESEDRPR